MTRKSRWKQHKATQDLTLAQLARRLGLLSGFEEKILRARSCKESPCAQGGSGCSKWWKSCTGAESQCIPVAFRSVARTAAASCESQWLRDRSAEPRWESRCPRECTLRPIILQSRKMESSPKEKRGNVEWYSSELEFILGKTAHHRDANRCELETFIESSGADIVRCNP